MADQTQALLDWLLRARGGRSGGAGAGATWDDPQSDPTQDGSFDLSNLLEDGNAPGGGRAMPRPQPQDSLNADRVSPSTDTVAGSRGRALPGDIELPRQLHTDINLPPDPSRLSARPDPDAGNRYPELVGRADPNALPPRPDPDAANRHPELVGAAPAANAASARPAAPEHPTDKLRKFFISPKGPVAGDHGNFDTSGPPAVSSANAAIDASRLHGLRASEMQDNLNNDPTNPRLQAINRQLQGEEMSDPYSSVSREKKTFMDLLEDEAAQRVMRPDERRAKEQSMKDAGTLAHNTSYGTEMGKEEGIGSGVGQSNRNADSQRKINEELAVPRFEIGGGEGGGGDNTTVSYWADQVQHDPKQLAKLSTNKPLAIAVQHELARRGVTLDELTNQAKTRAEMSETILPKIDSLLLKADTLEKAGWFGPVAGRGRRVLTEHGLGGLLGDPDMSSLMNEFQTELGLATKAVISAHAGARGAASVALGDVFGKLVNANNDLPGFTGQMRAVRHLLQAYADKAAPVVNGQRQLQADEPRMERSGAGGAPSAVETITQRNKATGQIRTSTDGGKTWVMR